MMVLLMLAFAALPFAVAAEKGAGDEQTIRKIEDDWAVALVKADTATSDRITTEDWTVVTPDGAVQTRAEFNAELRSGAVKFDSFHLDDLKVRIHGDTAIVTGLDTEKSFYKGEDNSGQYRFTDVFVKQAGQWRAVASHVTKVTKK
jgi:ketosteroid isomerase-like protein